MAKSAGATWSLLALLVALPVLGCGERGPANTESAGEPAGRSADVARGRVLPESAVAEPQSDPARQEGLSAVESAAASSLATALLRLPGGVTLDEWLAERETAPVVSPIGRHRDGTPLVCAMAVDQDTVGRMVRRSTLYFHPPPVGSQPPTATREGDAVRISAPEAMVRQGCRVAAVEAELTGTDSAGTARLARAVWQSLTDALGPPADSQAVDSRPGRSTLARRWRADSLTYVVAALAPDGPLPGRVWARAELPAPPFTPPDYDSLAYAGPDSVRRRLVREQAAATGKDAAPLLDLLGEAASGTVDPARAVDALRGWLEGAAELDSLARARVYLAAHLVLARATHSGDLTGRRPAAWPQDSLGRAYIDSLDALGARFLYSEIHGQHFYGGAWLSRAEELDPDGPIGRAVRLIRPGSGVPWTMKCPGRQQEAIAALHARLTETRDPQLRARRHYLLASAHRDYVLFADHQREVVASLQAHLYGTDDDAFLDGYAHRPNAVENYLTAAALAESERLREAAWWSAWYLAIGYRLEEPVLSCLAD